MKTTTRKELITYLAIWTVLFLAPLLSTLVHSIVEEDYTFKWMPVLHMWDGLVVMLIAFIVHNFFLAPRLLFQHKWKGYAIAIIVIAAIFTTYKYYCSPPQFLKDKMPPPIERHMANDNKADKEQLKEFNPDDMSPRRPEADIPSGPPRHHDGRPPLSPMDLMSTMLLLALLAANLGLKTLFRNIDEGERQRKLEQQNLKQELSYLKYQVNPHFLMNTLNNIHALVDIDPERSKTAIVKLSQLLRYMLYEGSKSCIPLDRGITFLSNYIDLMRLRYNGNVDISFNYPKPIPNVEVLPLLVITFVENAFKHGVSYAEPSFVHISIDVDNNNLVFKCRNSKHSKSPRPKDEHGGFGLANVAKRLELIFGNKHTFDIIDEKNTFTVLLIFPLDLVKDE